jgi:superfamily II RNA helicase
MAGVVEAWAAGATWSQLMADSSMEDGDMARLLIRTTDLLRQVGS